MIQRGGDAPGCNLYDHSNDQLPVRKVTAPSEPIIKDESSRKGKDRFCYDESRCLLRRIFSELEPKSIT